LKYKHLNIEERRQVADLHSKKSTISEIANILKRNKSTISREIKRNSISDNYWPDSADTLSKSRRLRENKIISNSELEVFIWRSLVQKRWSPEQIAGWLKINKQSFGAISHESIYKWIYLPYKMHSGSKLWKYLARHKRKRGIKRNFLSSATMIPNRISIHERPKYIKDKLNFGHWEGDLMSFIKNSQHIIVLHERKTLFIKSLRLKNKQANTVTKALFNLMGKLPLTAKQTLTLDNGGEFTEHEKYKAIGLKSYFCDPYCSWQKGGVENSNSRLRIVLPRHTDVKSFDKKEFEDIILNHNSTPRKRLGWLTPKQAFIKDLEGLI
jgi:IS30 family transposase